MSLLIDLLTECWIVDDTSLSDNNFIVSMLNLVVRFETPKMSYMSTPLFDIELIGLEIPNLVQPIIGSGNQPYNGY